jgi:hypothetical protein
MWCKVGRRVKILSISLIVDRSSTTDARTSNARPSWWKKSLAARHNSKSYKRRVACCKIIWKSLQRYELTNNRKYGIHYQSETFSLRRSSREKICCQNPLGTTSVFGGEEDLALVFRIESTSHDHDDKKFPSEAGA